MGWLSKMGEKYQVTLEIVYFNERYNEPEEWDWQTLLDLGEGESAVVVEQKYLGQVYRCSNCHELVEEDDTLWLVIDGDKTYLSTGDDSEPFHVECAPEYEEESLVIGRITPSGELGDKENASTS